MQRSGGRRGPRGKYARAICQNCRSRKIKCVLPYPDHVGPQSPRTSCERCSSLGLACIVEATTIGRPALKRTQEITFPDARVSPFNVVPRSDGDFSSIQNLDISSAQTLDIQDYLWAESVDEKLTFQQTFDIHAANIPSRHIETKLQSVLDPSKILSSTLTNDRTFGSIVTQPQALCGVSLLDIITEDITYLLDEFLAWHRLFLPQTPTLVGIRNRLISDSRNKSNCATNLLFALLSLIALEVSPIPLERYQQLIHGVRLAIATYGQVFIFSPPTHRDSLVVSLLLADYRPTALISSQSTSHSAVTSELYVTLAYRIADRLSLLPAQTSHQLEACSNGNLEELLTSSLQGFQIYCYDLCVNNFLTKPLENMQHALAYLRPLVEVYRRILKDYHCLPRVVYHLQYAICTFIRLEAITNLKRSRNDLKSLSTIIDETEEKTQAVADSTRSLLSSWPVYDKKDELLAVSTLLELRCSWVSNTVCSVGILYAMALGARPKGNPTDDIPITSYEDIMKVGALVIDGYKNIDRGKSDGFLTFLKRFGRPYPHRLHHILQKFVECSENLSLNGLKFHPPPRILLLEMVVICKNIVENCIIHLKIYNSLYENMDQKIELFTKCIQQINQMVASPWNSVDEAFASGCVYAACGKLISRLLEAMKSLKTKVSMDEAQKRQGQVEISETSTKPCGYESLDSMLSFNGWGLWSQMENNDIMGGLQGDFDWSTVFNVYTDTGPTTTFM